MENTIENTKSFTALFALLSLAFISIVGVNSLNPTAKLLINVSSQNVAGAQDEKLQSGDIRFRTAGKEVDISDKALSFNIGSGITTKDLGVITLKNLENKNNYAVLSAEIPPELSNILRIELIDEYNKILLADSKVLFNGQKVTFTSNEDRSFNIRYSLIKPVNYTSTIKISIN